MPDVTVSVRTNTKLAVPVLRVIRLMTPLLGVDRALRWAGIALNHMIFYRIDGGSWRRLNFDIHLEP